MRRTPPASLWIALLALVLAPRAARSQLDAGPPGSSTSPAPDSPPPLVGLSPDEFQALRPLAMRGMAILVRDPDAGPRARITVLVRARAPLDVVRNVITTPESYTTFMPTLSSVEILSRHGRRTAFRFHISAIIFDVTALSALQIVNDRRVDVQIVQADIGPGGSRWDMMPDGDGTLVALSTWGDPTRGNWFLRQVAARSPNAIAGMNISADTILALGVARRSEILAGRPLPVRPSVPAVASGPLEPPAPGAWTSLTRNNIVIASVALDDQGSLRQTSVAAHTPEQVDAISSRLANVRDYPQYWDAIQRVDVVSEQGNTVRYRTTIHSALTQTQGEEERSMDSGPNGPVVRWHGLTGSYVGNDHRWDLWRDDAGGTVVLFTGGSEYNRAGLLSRTMMDRDAWLTPGYATSYLLVWMRPLLETN